MQYAKKFVVMVNLEWDLTDGLCKMVGEVYAVKDSEDEAYALATELGDTVGGTLVVKGHNPNILRVGGMTLSW